MATSIGDQDVTARSLLGLSQTYLQMGNTQQARYRWAGAKALIEELGLGEAEPRMYRIRALYFIQLAEHKEARQALNQALGAAERFQQHREKLLAQQLLATLPSEGSQP